MAKKPGLSTGHACAPSADGILFLIHIFLTGGFYSLIQAAISINVDVYVSSGDVCTDGLFQCVGVAP